MVALVFLPLDRVLSPVDDDVLAADRVVVPLPIVEIVLQGFRDHGKRQLIPRNLVLGEEASLMRFDARAEIEIVQSSPVKHVDLGNMRQAEEGVEFDNSGVSIGFLPGFPKSSLCGRFTILQKTGWESPESFARLDGASTQQYLVFMEGQATSDDPGILVVNRFTGITDVTGEMIAWWNSVGN